MGRRPGGGALRGGGGAPPSFGGPAGALPPPPPPPGPPPHGSRGHGRSHVMPALIAPYATVPVLRGEMALGIWQSVAFVDLNVDNPDRRVRLSFLADPS